MSLGGASGYMQPGGNSAPLDQSLIPYLPYAQQGPYQAIMSQMGNYGAGAGNFYGGTSGGAMGGFNPDLYKRATAAVPVVADIGSTTRGGGSRDRGDASGDYGARSFNYDPNSYTGGLLRFLLGEQTPAPIVDTSGFSSVAEAEAAQPGINSGVISQPNPISGYSLNPNSLLGTAAGSNIGTISQPNPISGYSIGPAAPAVSDGGFNPISGYSLAPAPVAPSPAAPAPVAVAQPETYSPVVSNDISSNDNYSNEGYSRGYDGGGDRSYSSPSNGGESGGWGSRDAGGQYKGGYIKASMLHGPDPAGPDEGYRALKSGEFVINDKAVKKYGIELMNAINSGKISKGKLRGLLEM
jgi:hypothetical protein